MGISSKFRRYSGDNCSLVGKVLEQLKRDLGFSIFFAIITPCDLELSSFNKCGN